MECGAVGGFSEEQFREACAEIQQRAPAGANWELLVETLGFSIYGLLDQVAAGQLEDPRQSLVRANLPRGSAGQRPRKSGPELVTRSREERTLGQCWQLTLPLQLGGHPNSA